MSDVDSEDPPRQPSNRHELRTALAFAAVYLIWGSTYLAIRVGVRSIPPFLMSGCRFVGAGGMLYALLRLRGTPAPSRGEWARASIAGGLMLTMGNGLVTWAERRVPSNLAALIVAAVPLGHTGSPADTVRPPAAVAQVSSAGPSGPPTTK